MTRVEGTRALVLGGGGITGIAWEIGVLAGLAAAKIDLGAADAIVGTSAGSVVGALVASGVAIEDLYASQLVPPAAGPAARLGRLSLLRFVLASLWPGSDQAARARVGRMAARARTKATSEERVAVIRQAIGGRPWPERRLLITAVDAATGDERIFDRESGAQLAEAVAASCAVPLVWPPVRIGGRDYIDGGVRSIANADLAAGAERVVVLAPVTFARRRSGRIATQLAALGPAVRSIVVTPDAASRSAIGKNVLDPARRGVSAQAGRKQGSDIASAVAEVWADRR
jgi:NTE family protein